MATSQHTRLLFSSLAGYNSQWLKSDVVAGLTVWAVLIPESLAYATIAGVSPVVGLYAAIPSLILYAAFGSSRHLIVGPMSATAALSAGVVAVFAPGNAAAFAAMTSAVALVTGVLCLVAGICRLGFLTSFISEPVLKGFIVGLALTIVIGQVPGLVGVKKGHGSFFEQAWAIIREITKIQPMTCVVGLGSIVVVLVLKKVAPKVPGSLVAVFIGIGAIAAFNLDKHGVDIVGHITAGLPKVGIPHDDGLVWREMLGPCIGVMLVGFVEALGAAKTYAQANGYDIDTNRELIGMGAANLGAGLTSGMVVNGSLSKTAVNGGAGAKTQMSGIVTAGLTILTLLFLTPLFESLPEATLSAVVICAVIELIDVPTLLRYRAILTPQEKRLYGSVARNDFFAALAALVGVLVFDTLPGLIIGVILAIILLIVEVSRPHVALLAKTQNGAWLDAARLKDKGQKGYEPPDTVVIRLESSLIYVNADHVRETIRDIVSEQKAHRVILDCETMATIDVAGAQMLVTLMSDLQRENCDLVLARAHGAVRDLIHAADARKSPVISEEIEDAMSIRPADHPGAAPEPEVSTSK